MFTTWTKRGFSSELYQISLSLLKVKNVRVEKRSKERLTVALCVNAEGTFEKPLVIGKAAVPRCFRNLNVKTLPVMWRHNKKAWMTRPAIYSLNGFRTLTIK